MQFCPFLHSLSPSITLPIHPFSLRQILMPWSFFSFLSPFLSSFFCMVNPLSLTVDPISCKHSELSLYNMFLYYCHNGPIWSRLWCVIVRNATTWWLLLFGPKWWSDLPSLRPGYSVHWVFLSASPGQPSVQQSQVLPHIWGGERKLLYKKAQFFNGSPFCGNTNQILIQMLYVWIVKRKR